ncbi:hypothetical protein CAPTEDRAFT_192171 [Capitella teleta]|uniref:Uncharacterized protein n=1 Tax=Capitella teleta TaxID=283909 RepID=R7T766_CAPTE|nr:hypothetical protein CAPTEDRAFT_192171 [Capitella teleta]|eukprot:ELT89430.1 hypothetical protein CAPTEDRAFT_192171 [Capitella teleta]
MSWLLKIHRTARLERLLVIVRKRCTHPWRGLPHWTHMMCNKRTRGYQMCNKRTRGFQMCNKRTRGYQMQMMTDEESQPLRSFGVGCSCNRWQQSDEKQTKKKDCFGLGVCISLMLKVGTISKLITTCVMSKYHN